MTPEIEDRLRQIAVWLDNASERYTHAHVQPQAARRPTRGIAVIAASVVILAALVVAAIAMTSKEPTPALAPTTVDSSNAPTPTPK